MRLSSSCSTCRSRKKKCVALASGNICALCMAKTLQCDLKARRKSASSRRQLALQSAEQEVSTDRQTANKCDILQHSVCDELIELYFDMIHNKQLILFHRRTFLEQRRSGSLPTYLLLGALAVVARFSTNPYFNGIEPTARARPLLHRALKSFNDRQIPISVHSLQAAILLAFTCFVEGERDEEALLSAQAVRMVQLLDLPHRSPAGTVEHEIEIRLFWHALMMDVWHSARERLPRQLIAKPTIPLPLEEEQFENMSPTEERQVVGILMDTDRNSGIMTNVTRLSETYAEIMQLNDMLVHDPSFDFLRDHKVIHLTYQLDEWLRTLPKHLHNTPENLQAFAARNRGRELAVLHLIYHHQCQLLYYQFLHPAGMANADKVTLAYAARCKSHAEALSALMWATNTMHKSECLWSPVNGHLLVVASSVHLHSLLFPADDSQPNPKIRRLLEQNFVMLQQFQKYWPTLKASLSRLHAFHRSCYSGEQLCSFQMDSWMFEFLNNYDIPINERDLHSSESESPDASFLDSGIMWLGSSQESLDVQNQLYSLLSFDCVK